jgi:hypothetical protein
MTYAPNTLSSLPERVDPNHETTEEQPNNRNDHISRESLYGIDYQVSLRKD